MSLTNLLQKRTRLKFDLLRDLYRETAAKKEQEIREYQIDQARTAYLNAQQAEKQMRERLKEVEAKLQDLQKKLSISSKSIIGNLKFNNQNNKPTTKPAQKPPENKRR